MIRYAGLTAPEERNLPGKERAVEGDRRYRELDDHEDRRHAQRVTVYVGNSDTWHGRNLVTAIVEKCRELGIAGATASVGVRDSARRPGSTAHTC